MEFVESVYDTIWSPKFWLPPNVTWEQLEGITEIYMPRPRHMWRPFGIAIVLFLLRLLWERFVALPLGRYFNIKETPPRKPVHNEVLEAKYKHSRHLPGKTELQDLSSELQWTTRQIERWWRRRRVANKPTEMVRWKETTWRFLFYVVIFWYGIAILHDKSWFWSTKYCWIGYPYHELTDSLYWYYMIELGFYWSLVISLFMDVKRKDFVEMIVHHIAAISLMWLSYCNNLVRMGTLVLVVHDAVDWLMEAAKLCKYARYQKLCDSIFVLFTIMWFITRIVIYPIVVLRATTFEIAEFLGMFDLLYMYNLFLYVLQILHIFWFHTILRMVWDFLVSGEVQKDERSETEPETNSDDENIIQKDTDGSKKNNSNNNVTNDFGHHNAQMANGSSGLPKSGISKIPVKRN